MTRYELFQANKSLIEALVDNIIDIKDVKYLPLVAEYKEMKAKHHKVGYIVYHLSEKYQMSERGIYKLIDRMTKRVKL
jgi:hypothetical protein